jgi:hypothetical protein
MGQETKFFFQKSGCQVPVWPWTSTGEQLRTPTTSGLMPMLGPLSSVVTLKSSEKCTEHRTKNGRNMGIHYQWFVFREYYKDGWMIIVIEYNDYVPWKCELSPTTVVWVQTGDDCTNFCDFENELQCSNVVETKNGPLRFFMKVVVRKIISSWLPCGQWVVPQAFRNEWEGQTFPSGSQTLQWVWQWEILEVMERFS